MLISGIKEKLITMILTIITTNNNYLAEQYNYHVKYNNINIPVKINSVMFDISIGKKIQFALCVEYLWKLKLL